MRESLMELISHLCQVPIPPPGPLSIVSARMRSLAITHARVRGKNTF